jgi:hypothetical protein
VGAGVLLGTRHVLTCAHVVSSAAGCAGPDTVLVDFPVRGGEPGTARVVDGSLYAATEDGRGDLAALMLDDPVTGIPGAPLARIASTARNRVRLYGFPRGHENGVRVFASLSGPAGPGWEWIQLDAVSTTGQRIQEGFSGTPVVDEYTGLVIGIAVAADRDLPAKVAWMLPVRTMARYWAALADSVVGWSVAPGSFEHFYHSCASGVRSRQWSGDYFTGRRAVLRRIVHWLDDGADSGSYVITGDPGSGKSAVISRLVTFSDRALRGVEGQRPDASEGTVPRHGSIGAAVHASGLTVADLVTKIAALTDVEAADSYTLVGQLTEEGRPPLVIVVDAVDEAADPDGVIEQLLIPLMDRGRLAGLRLLLGTRRDLLSRLGQRAAGVIDLDSDEAFDQTDIAQYVTTVLSDSAGPGGAAPYHGDPALAATVGRAVARRAGHSFLIAQLVAADLVTRPDTVDVAAPDWQNQFATTVSRAMKIILDHLADSLEGRNGPVGRSWLREILAPLAYAEGQGLTADALWADLATALAPGTAFTEGDIHNLVELWRTSKAANILKPSDTTTAGGPAPDAAWRLFHQAFADHLRDPQAEPRHQSRIVGALLARVPRTEGQHRRWRGAHPYILQNLATHAAAAGHPGPAGSQGPSCLDGLVTDPGFLVHADSGTLGPALRHVTSVGARTARAVFLTSAHRHRLLDSEGRRQLLAVDAARLNKDGLRRDLAMGLDWVPRWATGSQVTAALRASLTGHTGSVEAVACTVLDGTPVAVTGGNDHTACVWDLATGRRIHQLTGHDGEVSGVACAVVGGRPVAVTASTDHTACVWDLATGRRIHQLTGHDGEVKAVACTVLDAAAPIAVTAGADGMARM